MNGDHIMFLDCPAYLDHEQTVRCGLPAEVSCKFPMDSSDGPLESAMIRCPAGHWFNAPIEFLTCESADNHQPVTAAAAISARRAGPTGTDDGRTGTTGPVVHVPAEPGQEIRRPNTAPAYYLGRPASVWITAMRPRRRRAASHGLMQAVTGRAG
jgi:hypothetical protein